MHLCIAVMYLLTVTTVTNNSSFPSLVILVALLEPQICVFTTVFLKLSFTLEPLQKSHSAGPLPRNCLTFSTRKVQLVVSFKVGVIVNVPITSGKKKPRFGNTWREQLCAVLSRNCTVLHNYSRRTDCFEY